MGPPSGSAGNTMGGDTPGQRGSRMANPKNPWADQDPNDNRLDNDTRAMWDIKNQGGITPKSGMHQGMMMQGAPQAPPGRSKAGRDGKGDGGKKGRGAMDVQGGATKWVEKSSAVDSMPIKGQGKGSQHSGGWDAPKELPPKAPLPAPMFSAPPPSKGGGGGGGGDSFDHGGGKKKPHTRRDKEIDGWFASRMGDSAPQGESASSAAPAASHDNSWAGGGKYGEDDWDDEDDADRRGGKKKGGKGGKGKAADRGRDKGKGKGKARGGAFWQSKS